ncbi:MAG: rhamnulokinase [Armatimonadota bacterium]
MSTPLYVAAVDFGAESGRVSLGRFDGTRLEIEVVHRFPNRSVKLAGTLCWITQELFRESLIGLRKAREVAGVPIAAVSFDTWGVDFGILDGNGQLIGVPAHYRDKRTEGLIEEVTAQIPREEIFAKTGIAFWPFNTLYQLRALAKQNSPALREGQTLLFTPDLMHYWMCGAKVAERSIASTSQCLSVGDDVWQDDLLESLGIPAHIMPPVVPSGTVLGNVFADLADEYGLAGMQVIASAGHDTAAAVAATPLSSPQAAYLSSGTWSLLGVETATPMPTPAALAAEFTNEKGVGQTYRFLKNIMGLWLQQSSRAVWAEEGKKYEYPELAALAEQGAAFQRWINPNDLRFYAPVNMVKEVQQACADSGQPVPQDVSEVMRCLLESLAFTYRVSVDQIEELQGISVPCLHIIGGGSQNKTLSQWTANALGRPVITGPVEGTTMGNMLVQLMALGEIADISQIRQVVRQSCEVLTYEPQQTPAWEDAYHRYRQVTGQAVRA